MRVKAAFLLGGAVGYVLGTRAGREQFEKIRSSAQTVWHDPRVQGTVSEASTFVKEKAPDLKEKVGGAVKSVTNRSGGSDEHLGSTYETSTQDLSGTDTLSSTTTPGSNGGTGTPGSGPTTSGTGSY